MNIKDLKKNEVTKDAIIWVKLIANPCHLLSVILVVQDNNGDTVSIGLYN
jgi:hypothetical protein